MFNTSGRYWVKLYYLGKARKIEIDDFLPINAYTRKPIFPTTEKLSTIWPMLLTKAVYQLFDFLWKGETPEKEVGEGAVMYALTGLIPCTIKTQDI